MIPLLFAPFLSHPLLLPICFPLLTWNPPCYDRIRPPRSQVARKLDSPFPSPCSYTPHSRIPAPLGFPHPNIHSLGRHRKPGSQDPAQNQSDVELFFPRIGTSCRKSLLYPNQVGSYVQHTLTKCYKIFIMAVKLKLFQKF
jgi:hypothetical protein